MCGIVGALVLNGGSFAVSEAYINGMRDAMAHRGPDGAGTYISPDGRVGLGHRRLSIIDLSAGAAQPMPNEDGSIIVSFNGEIYNHAEVRAELLALGGHTWRTDHSDTEVILHAFEQWGIDCLQRFRGMFAFALWDGRRRELWLVRDRIGIKPLYYSVHNGRLTFASEIKALLADPDQPRAVDEESFYHYLSFLTTPAPRTLFAGIRKLAGGTWLRVRADGQMSESRYWDVWDHTTPLLNESDADIAHRLLEELRTSVQLRKVSDVPVGVFLSGGIDSSTNAALFSEGAATPVQTFSIGYDGEYRTYRNELDYAQLMASRVGAVYRERRLTMDDLLSFLPRMVQLQDEPIADPVCVPVYYVSKLARDNGVTVCQLGEGSDELFWGYPYWKRSTDLARLNELPVPRWSKRALLTTLRAGGRSQTGYYEWLRRATQGLPIFWGGAEAFTESQKRRLLSPRLRSRLGGLTSWEPIQPTRDRFEANAWDTSPLSWMSYLDLNLRLPELLLMRVDKMSMGVSLEARVPFLDHKFVELAMSIPPAVKMRGGTLKHILKKAVRGVIPDELIDRKKQGFGVPIHEWFLKDLGSTTRATLATFCKDTDFFSPAAIDALISQGDGERLWYVLNFALWWNEYIA